MVSPHYEFRIGFIDCRIENWYATIYTRKWLLSTMHSELVPVGSTWFFKFTLCMFCIHIVYRGIRILHELFVNASSISLCVCFFIHIGYRVSWFFLSCLYMILKHHFLCVFYSHWLQGYHNSPRIVSMWFFKFSLSVVMYSQWLQGYHNSLWVVLYDSSISLYVWFCIHIGYLYHDSLRVVSVIFQICFVFLYSHWLQGNLVSSQNVSMWFFEFTLCVVLYSHWLQGYRDSSWVVSKWFFNFALCDLVFSLYDFVFVSWFIMSCLYVILQLHFVCGFVFTLVTGDIIILQIFSSAEGGMKQISYKGDIVIGDAKIGMIFRGDKSNNSARGCFERGICRGGFFD